MGDKAITIQKQIKKLEDRVLIIKDKPKAEETLLDIGYYRLGFYWYYFQNPKKDHEFNCKIELEEIVKLYYFDFDIKHLLSKYIYRIEVHFRTQVLYFVSNHYNKNNTWYVDPTIVNNHILKEFNNIYFNIKKSGPLKKHHNKHKKHIYAPAWKTFEFLTFGQIFKFYSNLKNNDLKNQIAGVYGIKDYKSHYEVNKKEDEKHEDFEVLENFFKAIIRIRNICSHNGVLYDFNQPVNIWTIPDEKFRIKGRNNNNLTASIRLILYILSKVSVNRVDELNKSLKEIFNKLDCCKEVDDVIQQKINFDLD